MLERYINKNIITDFSLYKKGETYDKLEANKGKKDILSNHIYYTDGYHYGNAQDIVASRKYWLGVPTRLLEVQGDKLVFKDDTLVVQTKYHNYDYFFVGKDAYVQKGQLLNGSVEFIKV